MQMTRVEGRVAQVLDERRLVINRGRVDGVQVGMRFEVKAGAPVEIRDPETDEVLDVIDRVKVRVEATEVRERITICTTYEYRDIGAALGLDLNTTFGPRRKRPVTFETEPSVALPPLDPEQAYIRKGDRAIQIAEPE